jgi:hypothetical protein
MNDSRHREIITELNVTYLVNGRVTSESKIIKSETQIDVD